MINAAAPTADGATKTGGTPNEPHQTQPRGTQKNGGTPMNRPCLTCGTLTRNTRCKRCTTIHDNNRYRARPPRPHHTDPNYRRTSQQLRTMWNADPYTTCWICGEGARPGDPWQADHHTPGDPTSILLPAHRTCNARRGAEHRWTNR